MVPYDSELAPDLTVSAAPSWQTGSQTLLLMVPWSFESAWGCWPTAGWVALAGIACGGCPVHSLLLRYFCINSPISLSLSACIIADQVQEVDNIQWRLSFALATSRATMSAISSLFLSICA